MVRASSNIAGIKPDMHQTIANDYIPQLTICASALAPESEYRIVDSSVEFRIGTSPWRILTDEEIREHFRLHTEVASWLGRECKNSWVWS
jgi:hypothetical protein